MNPYHFRESGYCYICYIPWYYSATMTTSFGLSLSSNAAAKAERGTQCTADYIIVCSYKNEI